MLRGEAEPEPRFALGEREASGAHAGSEHERGAALSDMTFTFVTTARAERGERCSAASPVVTHLRYRVSR